MGSPGLLYPFLSKKHNKSTEINDLSRTLHERIFNENSGNI